MSRLEHKRSFSYTDGMTNVPHQHDFAHVSRLARRDIVVRVHQRATASYASVGDTEAAEGELV